MVQPAATPSQRHLIVAAMTTSYYDVAAGLGAAGFAGGLSVAIMNPLDTLKVRYQVSTEPGGMRGFAGQIVRQEGLWRGLWVPGVGANFGAICISSVGRVGCYPYVRDGLLNAVGLEKNAGVMFVAGLLAGAVGYLVSSPAVWKSTSVSGAPDNSSLSHFLATTLP